MKILNELDELLAQGVISEETAGAIRRYYTEKNASAPNLVLVAFGILGALLVGLGLMLIIGHNWDTLPHFVKLGFAVAPLVVSQALAGVALFKKNGNTAWREASGTLLFLSIGGCLALVSQIYQISGDMAPFLFVWLLLALPIPYVLKASMPSLLFIALLTFYGANTAYSASESDAYWKYWLLLAAIVPYHILLYKKRPGSNFFDFHNWILPLSVLVCFGGLADKNGQWMLPAYMSLLGAYFLVGHLPVFSRKKLIANGFWMIGLLGTLGLSLAMTYHWVWKDASRYDDFMSFDSQSFWAAMATTGLAAALLIVLRKRLRSQQLAHFGLVFIAFFVIFIIGRQQPGLAMVLMNLLVFALGVLTIVRGDRENHLGLLNFGMFVVATLTLCRFFDSNWSFIVKGVLFLLIGSGFFWANYRRK